MDELLMSLLPLASVWAVVGTLLVLMLAVASRRSHFVSGTISVVGLNVGLFVLLGQIFGWVEMGDPRIGSLFVVDPFAQFNMLVIFVSALACCTLAYGYFETAKGAKDELYLLLLLATVGALLMVSAQHLGAFFVSLELLSVPLYGMLAYVYRRRLSLEAGIKYLVLSATASATLLMGMAFIFAQTGALNFAQLGHLLGLQLGVAPLLVLGSALMVFGVTFKLSAVPFHTWTPDVYEGANAPVATFLASVAKVAMVALVVRFLLGSHLLEMLSVQRLIWVIAALSIVVGNLLALRQTNLKRLLGYSSIAHMGYVLVVLLSAGSEAVIIVNMYMAVYALTSIGAFGVITLMSSPYREAGEADDLQHYQGLFWRRPVLTAVMTIMLLSLAGIPLTAGFITKFFAMAAAVQGMQWSLAGLIVVGSALGLFYYLRTLLTLFKRATTPLEYDAVSHWGIKAGGLMVILVTLAVLYFGILPNGLIEWAKLARLTP